MAAAAVLAALVAQVLAEAPLRVRAQPLVPAPLLASVQVVVGLAYLVVASALLPDLLSHQSCSAAMAGTTP